MKQIKVFILTVFTALLAVSCQQDVMDITGRLDDLENRVAKLEQLCAEMNTNLSAMQSIVTAMQTGDYITSVSPITEGGKTIGYTITFAKVDPITIYHGQDGADGQDGKDGADGQDGKDGGDGHTPVMGVKQDTDGIWYWTIDGEWLLDSNNQKVKAVGVDGKDGEDGVTPQLKIEEGYWYVSTDNGQSWIQHVKATGENGKDGTDGTNGTDGKDGDSMFQSVTVTDTDVIFVTADGQSFVVSRTATLDISFDTDSPVMMGFFATRDIHYTITAASDDVTIDALSSADIKVKVVPTDAKTGVLQVKTGETIDEYSKVVVLVSCGTQTITRTLRIQLETKAYHAPAFTGVDVVGQFYGWGTDSFTDLLWYNLLPQQKQAFIYPHLLVSYVRSMWYRIDNLEYIIMGEVPIGIPCENIGEDHASNFSNHADGGYHHIADITPDFTIKACGGTWNYLESYLDKHPDGICMVSCACDYLGGDTLEQLQNDDSYPSLKRILAKDNVMISVAGGNVGWGLTKTLSERVDLEEGGNYTSASVCSEKNNKICVVGYDPEYQNIFGKDEDSRRPVGFGKGNIVMPMMLLVANGYVLDGTHSSYPTAALSGTLGNFLSILMQTHPGVTLEGANTILQENYLREETFKYVDDSDGSIKDGEQWYFFNTDKFFEYELLQKEAVDAAVEKIAGQAGNDAVVLPSGYGLCYTGPGVQFEVEGVKYDMTEENRAAFETAWSADPSAIKWYFSPLQALVYGASGNAELTVGVLDTSASLIPDISRAITVPLP